MTALRFTKDHEWARLVDGIATIGITDHAQSALGDIVFIDLPAAGRRVAAGEACAVIESVKAASDVYAPFAGTITENNPLLADDPGAVNKDSEGNAWLFRLRPDNKADFDALLSAEDYQAFVQSL